jgi:virginiamycin A acetyltransferase
VSGLCQVVVGSDIVGIERVEFGGYNSVADGCQFFETVELGMGTTLNTGCVLSGPVRVGNYCQLAPHVAVYAADHPVHHLTTYTNRRLLNGGLKANVRHQPVQVGHGVWIGHGAVILKGVTIGNGAVVGAGSVVTVDVEPYSMVAGVPARVIGFRFEPTLRALVEATEWWRHLPDTLGRHSQALLTDLVASPEAAEEALSSLLRLKRASMDFGK